MHFHLSHLAYFKNSFANGDKDGTVTVVVRMADQLVISRITEVAEPDRQPAVVRYYTRYFVPHRNGIALYHLYAMHFTSAMKVTEKAFIF